MKKQKIIVVEDEPDLVDVVTYNLKREGYLVLAAQRGDEGINLIRSERPDLVLLDLMLPGMDGLSICRQMKSDSSLSEIPIIIASAKGEESDVVIGLEMGADDYLAKPFSPRELLARIKAVLRRGAPRDVIRERLVIRGLVIDSGKHEVRIEDEIVSLTSTEFKLLHHLASSKGRAFSREQLLNKVVGMGVVVVDRNIDVHIRAVRKKLGNHSNMIQTIRGVGYRFVED
ncbi:MAG: DNA-binding response regulator [Gammaproteobacteria bacterium TMED180]|nr:MAG: DNA-binding response regulator [Gammaproteobacteria bacterium TMED180]